MRNIAVVMAAAALSACAERAPPRVEPILATPSITGDREFQRQRAAESKVPPYDRDKERQAAIDEFAGCLAAAVCRGPTPYISSPALAALVSCDAYRIAVARAYGFEDNDAFTRRWAAKLAADIESYWKVGTLKGCPTRQAPPPKANPPITKF